MEAKQSLDPKRLKSGRCIRMKCIQHRTRTARILAALGLSALTGVAPAQGVADYPGKPV